MRRSLATFALSAAVALAIAIPSTPATASASLQNAGFQEGTINHWTLNVSQDSSYSLRDGDASPLSIPYLELSADETPGCGDCSAAGSVSQSFTAQAGDVLVGYARFQNPDSLAPASGSLTIGGTTIFTSTVTTGWTQWLYVVPADGPYAILVEAQSDTDNPGVVLMDFDMRQPLDSTTCTITGTAAAETLVGTGGDDVICGLGGGDVLQGLEGFDVLLGGAGNDRLLPDLGDDEVDGGAGLDTASYATADLPVNANLGTHMTTGEGWDLLESIENLHGSNFPDVLTGDAGKNRITGGKGDDDITGGEAIDRLAGGNGADSIDSVDAGGPDNLDGGRGPNGAIDTCIMDPIVDAYVGCEDPIFVF